MTASRFISQADLILGGGGSSGSGPWLPKFQSAVAKTKLGTANTNVLCIGDSTTFGAISGGTNTQKSTSYPSALAKEIAATGVVAAGWQNFFGSSEPGISAGTMSNYDSRFSMSGGFAAQTGTGPTVGGSVFKTAATGTISWHPTTQCDTFDVYYLNVSGSSWTWNLNGGSNTTVSAPGSTSAVIKQTVTGTLADNTLNVNWSAGNVWIVGIDAYNSAQKQISVWNGGWFGSRSIQWNVTGVPWNPVTAIPALAPHLTIWDIGINDWSQSTSLSSYQTAVQDVMTAALSVGDLIIKTPVPSQTTVAAVATQQQYVSILQQLAASNNVPLIDVYNTFGTWAVQNPLGNMSDDRHPTANGYRFEAATIRRALMNGAI